MNEPTELNSIIDRINVLTETINDLMYKSNMINEKNINLNDEINILKKNIKLIENSCNLNNTPFEWLNNKIEIIENRYNNHIHEISPLIVGSHKTHNGKTKDPNLKINF
jgi:chromosome segregation ATPase